MTGVVGPSEVAARAKLTQLTQEHRDLDAAIDAMVPRARYKHGTLKLVPLRKALQGLVGSGLVVTEAGHWRCTGGTGQ